MRRRVMRGRARARAVILANTASLVSLDRAVMHERDVRARARRPRIRPVYCRTALYGFHRHRGNLLVWRREMRSEGVANRPNGQRFWNQKTSLCLLHLPTVLQRPF